jgi:hypothetical protein
VAPVRNDTSNIGQVMFYNTTSKEITYGNVISVAGNITAGNVAGATLTGNLAGRVLTATQSGITSLGTLTNINTNGNANVALTVYSATVVATGNITAANIISPNYLFANGVNILSTVAGTYGNTQANALLSNGISLPTINNIKNGYSTTATAAGTTILTVNSNFQQYFTGSSTQTLQLPAPHSMTLGMSFYVRNLSTGNVSVIASNSAAIVTVLPGTAVLITCVDTTAGGGSTSWSVEVTGFTGNITTIANVIVSSTTPATTATTGAVIVSGGMGVAGNIFTTGQHTIANGTPATSAVSGALIVTGGMGITGNIFQTGQHTIANSTGSSDTVSGALIVTGGIGAGGNLNIGGNLVANVNISSTSSRAYSVGYLGMPQNATGTATLTIADAGRHVYVTTTGQTITIPANSSVAYPIGTAIAFIGGPSATTTTIAITTDTMYLAGTGTTGSRTLAAYGMATAVKVAATTWYINGSGLT